MHGEIYFLLGVLGGPGKKATENYEEGWNWIDVKMGVTTANVWGMDETE